MDDWLKWGTLVVAGCSALFSVLAWYIQRSTQTEIERLKANLAWAGTVHQKQLQVREALLEILDEVMGADALRQASAVREPHELDAEAEAVRLQKLIYRINDWHRKNDLFITQQSELKHKLKDIITQVEALSFEVQTNGPPMEWGELTPLQKSLDTLIEIALRDVNQPLKKLFAPIVEVTP